MEHYLDVSKLAPPEPLEQILDALSELPAGDRLRVVHRRDPVPLYPILRDLGYQWETCQPLPGQFEIRIWPAPPADAPVG